MIQLRFVASACTCEK